MDIKSWENNSNKIHQNEGKEFQLWLLGKLFKILMNNWSQVVEHGEEEVVRVEKDFQLVLHKISEVSQAEGPDCLNGDFVKVWNKPLLHKHTYEYIIWPFSGFFQGLWQNWKDFWENGVIRS